LQQVFLNLFTNALKFTPHGGTITVRTQLRDRHVIIEVADTGIGMRESDLERIFMPFLQLERRRGGLGLGLAISRQLLELHQGRIHAVSGGPGKGSTFVIELPVLPPGVKNGIGHSARKPAAPTAPAARADKLRLLLVEDHTSTRTTLRTLLTRRNFEVVTADSIAQARECITQGRFDILVSDLGLPDGHGHDLLREFRTHHPALVGLALSGYGSQEDRARSHAAGYASHLTKPVRIDELNEALEQVLAVTDPR
jgi:CheY-like chemotaxis protein